MRADSPEATLQHLLCSMSSLLQYYEGQVHPHIDELDDLKECIGRVRAKLDARIEADEATRYTRPVPDLNLERG